MSTGSDIAFWESLKDKVLHSRSAGLPACLAFSGDVIRSPAPLLSCCLFLVFMPICFLAFSQARNFKEDHIPTRIALQALVTIVVPTCSLWPSRYIKLAGSMRSHISIPFEVIIKDTIDGVIEFRNPSDDLADLISHGATVNGHTICMSLGWKWWVRCFKWWMLTVVPTAKSKSDCPPSPSPLSDLLHHHIPTADSSHLPPSPFAPTSSTLYPLLCLDCLPHGLIPTLNAGCTVTLEFTAFSSSLRTLSTAQIFSAIPFMIPERPHHPGRPRHLVSVLEQLNTSYGPNVTIDSLSNISVDYEHALRHVYKSLSGEQTVRETWVRILDIKAWRREMFLVALEAALVRRGWIERWAVQVTTR